MKLDGLYSRALCSQLLCIKWIAWTLMRVYCFFHSIIWEQFTCRCLFPLCSAIYSIFQALFVVLASSAELYQPSVTISTSLQGQRIWTTVPRLLSRLALFFFLQDVAGCKMHCPLFFTCILLHLYFFLYMMLLPALPLLIALFPLFTLNAVS